MDQKKPSTY